MDKAQELLLGLLVVLFAASVALIYAITETQHRFETRCVQAGGAPKYGICLRPDALVEVDK